MVNLVWTGIIKLADGNTAILQLVGPAVWGATRGTTTDRMAPCATIHYHCLLTLHHFFIKSLDLFPMNHKHDCESAQSRIQGPKTPGNREESFILRTFTLPVTCVYVRIPTKKRRRHVGPRLPYAVSALNRMGPGPWQTAVACTCNWQGYSIQQFNPTNPTSKHIRFSNSKSDKVVIQTEDLLNVWR